jgi:uncharacterized protein YneR
MKGKTIPDFMEAVSWCSHTWPQQRGKTYDHSDITWMIDLEDFHVTWYFDNLDDATEFAMLWG